MKLTMAWPAAVVLAMVVTGCGIGASPPPLRSEAFVPSAPGQHPGMISQPVDQNGALVYGELHAPLLPDEYTNAAPYEPPVISPVVRDAVASQTRPSLPAPATTATTMPASALSSTYEVVGTVVATVNDKTIFADKVLASIDNELAAQARRYRNDSATFREVAAKFISDRVEDQIRNYEMIVAANQLLSSDDKRTAGFYATQARQELVTAAGGSEELARQRAISREGTTLEEKVERARDTWLIRIYLQRRIYPRIQVTPTDMRRYYEQHLERDFTVPARAKFRLIKIDVGRSGGADQALSKAQDLLRRLKGGADFASLAHEYNDDSGLMQTGGAVGSIRRGDFVIPEVENQVWKLHPGEISDPPIQVRTPTGAAFYIALLEQREGGAVRPFDDPVVQETIHQTLESEQFKVLMASHEAELEREAVTIRDKRGFDAAVDMAMQRYPVWAAAP